MADVTVTVVGPGNVDLLAGLFEADRNTRSCWCTAFCTTRSRFAIGWVTGRNRRHFQVLAEGGMPMGLVASAAGQPVGWAACGPRSRYRAAVAGRSALLAPLDSRADEDVWFVPCLYARADHRGRGLTGLLVGEAVELARRHGARAVEDWPLSGSRPDPSQDHVGREAVFTAAGFSCLARPRPDRVLVRRELDQG